TRAIRSPVRTFHGVLATRMRVSVWPIGLLHHAVLDRARNSIAISDATSERLSPIRFSVTGAASVLPARTRHTAAPRRRPKNHLGFAFNFDAISNCIMAIVDIDKRAALQKANPAPDIALFARLPPYGADPGSNDWMPSRRSIAG